MPGAIIETTDGETTILRDVGEEVLVRHFMVPAEKEKLVEWTASAAPRPEKGLQARVDLALKLKDKGNVAAKQGKWPTAVWIYFGALYQLDFSLGDASSEDEPRAREADADAKKRVDDTKERINDATLLVLLNLSLAFLKRGDAYNSERAASLALWYANRVTSETSRRQSKAKLLFRRGHARLLLAKGAAAPGKLASEAEVSGAGAQQRAEGFAAALANPERFRDALRDLEEASALEKEAGNGRDKTLASTLAEALRLHKQAGGAYPLNHKASTSAPTRPPRKAAAAASTAPASSSSSSAAAAAAAVAGARPDEPSKTLAGAMSEPGWMGKEAKQTKQPSEGGEGQPAWDVVGQLSARVSKRAEEVQWGKVLLKVVFLAALEIAVKFFEVPGHEHLTPWSAFLALAVIALRPLFVGPEWASPAEKREAQADAETLKLWQARADSKKRVEHSAKKKKSPKTA